jgi:hypothetical protein
LWRSQLHSVVGLTCPQKKCCHLHWLGWNGRQWFCQVGCCSLCRLSMGRTQLHKMTGTVSSAVLRAKCQPQALASNGIRYQMGAKTCQNVARFRLSVQQWLCVGTCLGCAHSRQTHGVVIVHCALMTRMAVLQQGFDLDDERAGPSHLN